MFSFLQDVFADAGTRRLAHEEALNAIRAYGSGSVEHLEMRRRRTESRHRRQIYRLAIAMVPKLTQ